MVNKNQIQQKLQEELNKLKARFNLGHELKVKYFPDRIRINGRGNQLHGEIQANIILIYDKNEKEAINTMYHEYLEFIIYPMKKDFSETINRLNGIINYLLYSSSERVVDRFINGIKNR